MAILWTKLFHRFLLTRSCSLTFSPLISHSSSQYPKLSNSSNTHSILSTLAILNSNANSQYPNPFAEFAATKFNLSSADIACIFKRNPSLMKLKTLDQLEQFVDMLKRYGCTQHQIASIMKRCPKLLSVSPEKLLEPKIHLFRDLGIQGEGLAKILTRSPRVLSYSLQHSLLPALAFLKNIYKTHDLLIRAISKCPLVLTYDLDKTLKPSVAFWEGCGLTREQLSKSLSSRPELLLFTCLAPAKVDLIQKIGPDNGRKTYKHVLFLVVVSSTKTLEAKINHFQQLGLTTEETMELFRVSPNVFSFSEESVRQKFNFIVSEMGFPAHSVVKLPQLLISSLENVVKPRLLVLQKLNSLNGDEQGLRGISSMIKMSEAKFVSKFIKEHHESTLLNEIYQEALTNASTKSKMKASINMPKKYRFF